MPCDTLEFLQKKLVGAIIYNVDNPNNPKWIIYDVEELIGEESILYELLIVEGSNKTTVTFVSSSLKRIMSGNDSRIKIELMNRVDS